MVSIPIKQNAFREQIAKVLLTRKGFDKPLSSVIYTDKYPLQLSLSAQVDLFNILPDTQYQLIIQATYDTTNTTGKKILAKSELLNITNIISKKEDMLLDHSKTLGKTIAFLDLNLFIEEPSDILLQFNLSNIENGTTEVADITYLYLTFETKDKL